MGELVIGGDTYKLQKNDDNRYSLKRYNPKYKMWVVVEFTEVIVDVESLIRNTLEKQFIDRMLSL